MSKNLSLMFHRIYEPGSAKTVEAFTRYLDYLVHTFPISIPGQSCEKPLSITLIFDDAYVDFYEFVFPLLKKWKIQAILAVPTDYIAEKITMPMVQRLSSMTQAGTDSATEEVKSAFCSWGELQEMVNSGLVVIASHTKKHCHLPTIQSVPELVLEMVESKSILEKKLGVLVENFVYPYGAWTRAVHKVVLKYYRYAYRIGSALNFSQNATLFYRIDADRYWMNHIPIDEKQLRIWWWRALWNKVRFK